MGREGWLSPLRLWDVPVLHPQGSGLHPSMAGAFLPCAAHDTSSIPASTRFACAPMESINQTRGTQPPKSHRGRAAPWLSLLGSLAQTPCPKLQLPLRAPASLGCQQRCLLGPIPPSTSRTQSRAALLEFLAAPSLGWAGGTGLTSSQGSCTEGLGLTGHQQQQGGNATLSTHGVPGAGAAARAPGTAQPPPAPASRQGCCYYYI